MLLSKPSGALRSPPLSVNVTTFPSTVEKTVYTPCSCSLKHRSLLANLCFFQRHVLREDQEFDSEAFVRAADAAAEDPQVTLQRPIKELALLVHEGPVCTHVGISRARGCWRAKRGCFAVFGTSKKKQSCNKK